jgi:hypothetical protein
MGQEGESEAKYICQHFQNDFQQMTDMMSSNIEDLAASLHALLSSMCKPTSGDTVIDTRRADNAAEAKPWTKLGIEDRLSWEETLESKYLIKMIKEYGDQLPILFNKWGGAAEEGKFVAEIKETADVRDFPMAKRAAEMPQVWAFRANVTLDALHARMGVQRDQDKTLQVLPNVLQQTYYNILEALGTLVGVFEWHQLVMSHYSGRVSRSQAQEMSVRSELDKLPPAVRTKWRAAFEQFQKAWRIAWPYVERHDCLEISESLRSVMIDEDSSMIYCILDSENEGICPLALTQWLVARHNELVQIASVSDKISARRVSSRLLGIHDVIKYDGSKLMNFLQSRCVTYGDGGKLHFDLVQLERNLRRELARPEITVELRAFQWLGEAFTQTAELKEVMKQKDLSVDIMQRIRVEIMNPTLAHACLQKVSMSVSFILKAGGGLSEENTGELLLSEYMRNVLCDESVSSIPSATARAEVHLWHIDAFASLLKQIINADPMDLVDGKYKVDLPEDLQEAILRVKGDLPKDLATVLAQTAEARLGKDAGIGPETPLMDTLGFVWQEHDAAELPILKESLPKDRVLMKHWASVYRLLKK